MTDQPGLVVADPEAEAVTRRAEREQMSVEELDASNQERLTHLMGGHSGIPVQIAPGTFETIKTTTFLECALEAMGVLDEAKRRYAMNAAEVLDGFESTARMAAFRQGVNGPLDIVGGGGQNRQQRREAERRGGI